MVSEIKGTGPHTTHKVDGGPRQSNAAAPSAASKPAGATEVVTLTDLAARLQKLTDSVKDLPVVDQARVTEFRDALASGDYRMDERQIADKLASFEALVAGKRG